MSISHGDALPAVATPTSATSSSGFCDPGTLTRSLKPFMYLGIALSALSLASQLLELQLLNDMRASLLNEMQAGKSWVGEAAGNDLRSIVARLDKWRDLSRYLQIIVSLQFVNGVVVIVLFCIWIYRANYNARQLGATDMQFSPGWAVGWNFIPIANLWKPYQAMREIWQASADPLHCSTRSQRPATSSLFWIMRPRWSW